MDGTSAVEPPASLRWWHRVRWVPSSLFEAVVAEKQLLSSLKSPWTTHDIKVGQKKNEYLHTVQLGSDDSVPIVMMSGYGAGSGFWWRNLDSLSKDHRVYAVDWLGTGLSGRPPFVAKNRQEAEDFFLHPLDTWRKAMGLEKFVLVGHSLGGYLAATYALRHPEQVMHLVLVGPAGLPRKPENWPPAQFAKSRMWQLVDRAWRAGMTPGAAIRTLGPAGPGILASYVNRRFANREGMLSDDEPLFREYLYNIMSLPGSGEYALRHLLDPGAWAVAPLEEELHELKPPLTLIYGKEDWMNPTTAQRVVDNIRKTRAPQMESDLCVKIIEDAGHFVMFEQAENFNAALLTSIRPHLEAARQRRTTATASKPVPPDSTAGSAPQVIPASFGEPTPAMAAPVDVNMTWSA